MQLYILMSHKINTIIVFYWSIYNIIQILLAKIRFDVSLKYFNNNKSFSLENNIILFFSLTLYV